MKRSQLNAISRYYQEQRHQEAYRTMEKYGKTMKDYYNSKYVNVCAYAKSLGKNTATIVSNSTNERTYEVETGNALAVAKYLKNHPQVEWVNYPALEDDQYHERQQKA